MDKRLLEQVNHSFNLIQSKTEEEFAPLIFYANYLDRTAFTSDEYTEEEMDIYMQGLKRLKELKSLYYDKYIKDNYDSEIPVRTKKINEIINNIDNIYETELTKQIAYYDIGISFYQENKNFNYFGDDYYQFRKAFNTMVDWYRFKFGNIYVDNYCKDFCYYINEPYNLKNLKTDYGFYEKPIEGGYCSKDGSTIVYYSRSPYIRQVMQAQTSADMENKYHKWLKKFKEDGLLLETFAHCFG